jgi:energy-coupling factor transporter ATP-binding protein EcfA2
MSVLRKILEWSRELPEWQSDAIRRIFEKQTLDAADLDELTILAKVHCGIEDAADHVAQPLSQEQVPASSNDEQQVRLIKIRHLRHVNAVPDDQELRFAPEGLSVVYGDNGAGKSAYSRVLKRACRARDQSDTVLPNANLREEDCGTAEAICDVSVDGVQQEEHWSQDAEPPAILSSVAVFDARCARIYLDKDNEVAYAVYGLDIPNELANVCKTVKQRLQDEAESLEFDRSSFEDLEGETVVGRAVALLPGRADPKTFRHLAALEEHEHERLTALKAAVKQEDPAAKALSLGRLKTRLLAAGERGATLREAFSKEKLMFARKADEEWRAAAKAASIAAKGLGGEADLLPGTGGDAWKRMFQAARAYSEECAYEGHAFPHVEPGARCPLCQQVLEDGTARLKRFDEFIKDRSEQEAEAKLRERESIIASFRALNVSPLMDDPGLGEVGDIDDDIATAMRQAPVKYAELYRKILEMFETGKWEDLDLSQVNIEPAIRGLAAKLKEQVDALNEAAQGKHAKMQVELRELEAREKLGPRLSKVLGAIEQEKRLKAIENCARGISTTGISRKATELTEMAVTAELAQALNRELENLSVGNLRVVLTTSTVRGTTRHKLKLDLPVGYDLGNILSEGEQRVIAIASFLAEVSVTPGSETIVFDDPVSSLDHRWREAVARRLASEARDRQVIIFTHDLYFLNLLLHEAKDLDLEPLAQMVKLGPGGPGTVVEDLPFQGKNTNARIGELRQIQQKAGRLWRENNHAEYDPLVRDGYCRLRKTWERAIEEVLFNKTIERFRKSINTLSLRQVLIEPGDQEEVNRGMTKCSNFAHDNPLEAGTSVPPPEDFLADIEALHAFKDRIQRRRNRKSN